MSETNEFIRRQLETHAKLGAGRVAQAKVLRLHNVQLGADVVQHFLAGGILLKQQELF